MGLASGHPRTQRADDAGQLPLNGSANPGPSPSLTAGSLLGLEIGLDNLERYLDAELERWKGAGCGSEEHKRRRQEELQRHIATVKGMRERLRG
jgi:hypothetical protein